MELLSFLGFSQIWLNLRVDHRHFGYNTKLPEKHRLLVLAARPPVASACPFPARNPGWPDGPARFEPRLGSRLGSGLGSAVWSLLPLRGAASLLRARSLPLHDFLLSLHHFLERICS